MTFLNPSALFLIGLAPVILLLHIRRNRRKRVEVSALFLWPETLPSPTSQIGIRRLSDPLSLILQLLTLLCATLAAARPVPIALEVGEPVVIVADCSGRMRLAEPGIVLRETRAMLQRHPDAGIIRLSAVPEVIAAPGTRKKLPDLQPLASPSLEAPDYVAAFQLARDLLHNTGGVVKQGGVNPRIIWISDRPPLSDENLMTEFRPVKKAADNACVSIFSIEPAENASGEFSGFVEVRNHGAALWTGELRIDYDGRPHDVWELRLNPGTSWQGFFTGRLPEPNDKESQGLLSAFLLPAPGSDFVDALPEDNSAYAVAVPLSKRRILMNKGGDKFFELAMRADPVGEVEYIDSERGLSSLNRWPGLLALSDFRFLQDDTLLTTPEIGLLVAGLPGEQQVPKGGFASMLRVVDREHPVFRGVELTEVGVFIDQRDAVRIEGLLERFKQFRWSVRPMALAGSVPVVVAVENDALRSRALFLFFNSHTTDLPLRTAFPLLIANGTRWLTAREEGGRRGRGFFLGAPLPTGQGRQVFDIRNEQVNSSPSRPGFYQVRDVGGVVSWVAVNVDAAAISDAGAVGSEADLRVGTGHVTPQDPLRDVLWNGAFLLAVSVFLLLLADWELYRRRYIG